MQYNKIGDKFKNHLFKSATVKQIEAYTNQVRKGQVACGLFECPRCHLSGEFFKPHERKSRYFYVLVEQWVIPLKGLLIRWKCPDCNKTATDYPDFALPYKRYTVPTIFDFCERYVSDLLTSYRFLVHKKPLEYKVKSDSGVAYAPMMEHSTIHRWVTTLSGYSQIIRGATDLIVQADPITTVHRDIASLSIPSKKYRSPLRRLQLLECFRMVFVDSIYHSVFKVFIFPYLATRFAFS
jgi:transposase-like protein